ncbi:MAG: transcription termination/antitermination protein NusG [Prevotella sp.]|nr:transcription termination/antitermination protein NusG [Prevotella sp.]MCM1074395.1 transcription termination/antitermination protein NusG [Ruminococcus sp.]
MAETKPGARKDEPKEIQKGWFVLRAISGKEAKVKEILDSAIKNGTLGKHVWQVLIPTEKVMTTRNGKKVVKERTLYSGYVFVEAELIGEVEYELRNTTNVIDFLRGRTTQKPERLTEQEVMRMLGRADELQEASLEDDATFMVGEPVKVADGPFNGFSGVVKEVNADKKKLKVEVKIFGRATDLELDCTQVERE